MMSALGGVALSGTFEEVQSAMKRGGLTNDTSWSFCHGLDLATIDVTLGKDAANYCTRVLQPKTGCTEANGQFSGVTNGEYQLLCRASTINLLPVDSLLFDRIFSCGELR